MSGPSKIHWSAHEGVAVLSFDDGKANTFEKSTFVELEAALGAIAGASAGAVLIVGRPGFLSAGLDLKVLPAASEEERVDTIRAFGRAMLALFTFGKPVVAAVSGHALGAGAMLALAADVRLGAKGAFRFGLNEVPIGMVVPTFGVEIARASTPPQFLAGLLLHGHVHNPNELLAHGLVESLHAPDELRAAAQARAQGLAGLPLGPYRETKDRLRGERAAWAASRLEEEARTLIKALSPPG